MRYYSKNKAAQQRPKAIAIAKAKRDISLPFVAIASGVCFFLMSLILRGLL